jgi:hypothetical protein
MANKKYFPKKRNDYFSMLYRELSLMKKECECFTCKLCNGNSELICVGSIKPTSVSISYDLKIIYRPPEAPQVFVISPAIEYSPEIHMYKESKSLCLFYPTEMPWDIHHFHVSRTIFNWTAEWLVFYELYRITGIWEGKSASHAGNND